MRATPAARSACPPRPVACWGLKPSRGLLPQGPDFGNLLMGMASELVVSRTVRDSAAMLDACSGAPRGPYAAPRLSPTLAGLDDPLPPLRIAMVETGPSWGPVGAEQSAAVAAIAGLLADEGHRIGSLPPTALEPLLSAAARCFDVTICANLAALHASLAPPPASDDFEPMTWAAIKRGRLFTAADLFDAGQRAGARAAYDLALRFEQVDVLLTPMLAYAPPLVGAFSTHGFEIEAHFARMTAFAPYATLSNITGVPAISVPHGRDGDGMPLPCSSLVRLVPMSCYCALPACASAPSPGRFLCWRQPNLRPGTNRNMESPVVGRNFPPTDSWGRVTRAYTEVWQEIGSVDGREFATLNRSSEYPFPMARGQPVPISQNPRFRERSRMSRFFGFARGHRCAKPFVFV